MAATKASSLADTLVDRFVSAIDSGQLTPGERFPTEMTITQTYGVSRTVVREAFARLAAQGLLESRRGSGAYVAANATYRAFQIMPDDLVAIDDVLKLLEMRLGLEAEMAALAAERRNADDLARLEGWLAAMDASETTDGLVDTDHKFHAAIAAATGNAYFVRFTEFLGIRLVPSRRLYLLGEGAMSAQEYARLINVDHRAIVAAISQGDPEAARAAARAHLSLSIERYVRIRDRLQTKT